MATAKWPPNGPPGKERVKAVISLENTRVVSNRYFPVGIGRYFSVFTISIPKEISVGTFRYDFFGGKP